MFDHRVQCTYTEIKVFEHTTWTKTFTFGVSSVIELNLKLKNMFLNDGYCCLKHFFEKDWNPIQIFYIILNISRHMFFTLNLCFGVYFHQLDYCPFILTHSRHYLIYYSSYYMSEEYWKEVECIPEEMEVVTKVLEELKDWN